MSGFVEPDEEMNEPSIKRQHAQMAALNLIMSKMKFSSAQGALSLSLSPFHCPLFLRVVVDMLKLITLAIKFA